MKTFVKSSDVKNRTKKVDKKRLEKFIDKFNSYISGGEQNENGDGTFHLNTGLDKIPELNDAEFVEASNLAHEQGWLLSQYDDNYQSTTYKMQKFL